MWPQSVGPQLRVGRPPSSGLCNPPSPQSGDDPSNPNLQTTTPSDRNFGTPAGPVRVLNNLLVPVWRRFAPGVRVGGRSSGGGRLGKPLR